ncbi:hypothetical protein [Arthrobacter sp. 18067]|uniref:hypothetical protein n=1 Tax=Arthrobacter sp. 18067 TaxID=2681413 RepID=UPI001358B28D|nr:hypothetical protein [Arthrobacter sp. 18067]
MSKHDHPTVLSVIDRALGNQKRTARLQSLIVTITCCTVVLVALLATVLALSGGNLVLSVGFGSIPVLWAISKARKSLKKVSHQQ